MDYKYIEQLLERYWECETSLEEEEILRAFFSQKDVPARLLPYKELFTYEHEEQKNDVLGDDFEQKILSIIQEDQPQKARTVSFTQRLMPLFRAAAIVAIILTLGNALQVPFEEDAAPMAGAAVVQPEADGISVAATDSVTLDLLNKD